MTPKEKAIELVEKFKSTTSYKYQEYAGANYSVFEHDFETLKECAIFEVDEIIKNLHWLEDSINFDYAINYWQEVKQELDNLK